MAQCGGKWPERRAPPTSTGANGSSNSSGGGSGGGRGRPGSSSPKASVTAVGAPGQNGKQKGNTTPAVPMRTSAPSTTMASSLSGAAAAGRPPSSSRGGSSISTGARPPSPSNTPSAAGAVAEGSGDADAVALAAATEAVYAPAPLVITLRGETYAIVGDCAPLAPVSPLSITAADTAPTSSSGGTGAAGNGGGLALPPASKKKGAATATTVTAVTVAAAVSANTSASRVGTDEVPPTVSNTTHTTQEQQKAAPAAALSPHLDFGSLQVSDRVERILPVTNRGSRPLKFTWETTASISALSSSSPAEHGGRKQQQLLLPQHPRGLTRTLSRSSSRNNATGEGTASVSSHDVLFSVNHSEGEVAPGCSIDLLVALSPTHAMTCEKALIGRVTILDALTGESVSTIPVCATYAASYSAISVSGGGAAATTSSEGASNATSGASSDATQGASDTIRVMRVDASDAMGAAVSFGPQRSGRAVETVIELRNGECGGVCAKRQCEYICMSEHMYT